MYNFFFFLSVPIRREVSSVVQNQNMLSVDPLPHRHNQNVLDQE